MKWKVVSVAALFAVAILAVVLAAGRPSQAQATNPAPATYAYKVERVGSREVKDLEKRLNDDSQQGWRIQRVVTMGPYHNDLVIILEKPASAP